MSLFDDEKLEKNRELDKVIDKIRNKYGTDSITRSSFLNSGVNPMGKKKIKIQNI